MIKSLWGVRVNLTPNNWYWSAQRHGFGIKRMEIDQKTLLNYAEIYCSSHNDLGYNSLWLVTSHDLELWPEDPILTVLTMSHFWQFFMSNNGSSWRVMVRSWILSFFIIVTMGLRNDSLGVLMSHMPKSSPQDWNLRSLFFGNDFT